MDEANIAGLLANVSLWTSAVIGAASLIVQGIALITGITPTTRDDEIISKAAFALHKVQNVLNGVALNSVPAKPVAKSLEV